MSCPFDKENICSKDCPLFVAPDDLNEFVVARLSSIGILDRNKGACSIKVLALSQSRAIFENTATRG